MPMLSRMTSLWRNFFAKRRNDGELDDEVHSYVDLLAEEKMRQEMCIRDSRAIRVDPMIALRHE